MARARGLRLLGWTLAAGAIAVLAVVGLASSGSGSGRVAPELPREHLAGPPVVAAASAHRAKLVIFWASWCEPCVREARQVALFAQSPAGSGRVIGVDWSDALAGARSFIRRYSWSFSNVRDSEGTVGNDYRIRGLPTTFAIDAHGRIRATLRGPQDERSLARALASAAAS
jgi:cytochrome c biogenesis protein CcmG/thiol:disulfide interchange protein DsbE